MLSNRATALSYLELLAAGRMDEAFDLITEDCELKMPDGRIMDRNELRALFDQARSMFAGPFEQTIAGSTSEGNRVAVELSSRVALKNGKTYSNEYHFLFEFRDGHICRVAEYCDLTRASVFRD